MLSQKGVRLLADRHTQGLIGDLLLQPRVLNFEFLEPPGSSDFMPQYCARQRAKVVLQSRYSSSVAGGSSTSPCRGM
jgi:hypothetical protein